MMVREKFYLSIICICTLFTTIHCYAQNILRGTVVNEEGQKMEYTTIRLLNTDSTFVAGSITDTIGNYQFNTKTGQYIVVVSAIGYKTQTLPVTIASGITDAPIIKLLNESYVLDGVTITGSSFVRKKDHLLIHPDTKQTKHAHTGYDLLSKLMIPGVDVDIKAGKVKTFGGDVTLYIDGRKVDYREVQSLRPQDVERVEYYDVPTGKYANDVAAINYITRKYKAGGYIALDGSQTIGYLGGNYNVVAKLAHGNTSYTLFGGYKMEK